MVPLVHHINLGFVNSYLIEADSSFVLVDTGIAARRGLLEKALSGYGCTPGKLKLIVLTHGDIDHSGNCAYLRERYGVPVAMHRDDSDMVENGRMMPDRQVNSRLMRFMQSVMKFFGGMERMTAGFEKFKPDVYVTDGQSLAPYGLDATVLHIPGHTKGSIGVLLGNGDFICGDTMQNGKTARIIADPDMLAASIRRLASLSPKNLYPGHGKPFPWKNIPVL